MSTIGKETAKKHVKGFRIPLLFASPAERCLAVLDFLRRDPEYDGFDTAPLRQVSLISASAETRSTMWSLTVVPSLCNSVGNLHGGAAATLLDMLTTLTLSAITEKGFLDGGHLSRSLGCTFLRSVPVGEYVVESQVIGVGKSMACVRAEIRTLDGPGGGKGKVCVECLHDKAVIGGDGRGRPSALSKARL